MCNDKYPPLHLEVLNAGREIAVLGSGVGVRSDLRPLPGQPHHQEHGEDPSSGAPGKSSLR